MKHRRRKGISEVLSAVILIMVVVSGIAIYTSLSRERIFANTFSLNEALENSESRLSELIGSIYFTQNSDNATAYLLNYGLSNTTISHFMVGNTTLSKAKYDTYLLNDINFTKPLDKVVPVFPSNSTIKLFINQTLPANATISFVTENGKVYNIKR